MIYHPYFRGKQYELICLRELSKLINEADFRPIIEPVKSAPGGLIRCLNQLSEDSAGFLIVANPIYGDFKAGIPTALVQELDQLINENPKAGWAYILDQNASTDSLMEWLQAHPGSSVVHNGGGHSGNIINEAITKAELVVESNIFIESVCGKLYRNHFKDSIRILIGDGFQKRNNKEHPDIEPFSDLYLTYPDEGMQGFGDFSIVGNDYQESGGPAYAVAIHITFVDEKQDSAMFIHHFKSDTNNSPTDPAKKFKEALAKLKFAVDSPESNIVRTAAIDEFMDLQQHEHYPGLGYAKKLSMQHHLELISGLL